MPTTGRTGVVTAPGKRRSRYKRSADPPGMVLMPRDLEVLGHLVRFHRMTGQQIKEIVPFGSVQTANYRLQKLWQHGYVERNYWPLSLGSSPAVYRLSHRGGAALASAIGGDVARYTRSSATRDQVFLEHALAVSQVLIAFELAARRAGHRLAWQIPADALDRLPDPLEEEKSIPILPDAILLYEVGNLKVRAFLEVDRGTESLRRVASKVRGCLAYLASGNYQRQYGRRTLRLLIVAPSGRRLASLESAVTATVQRTSAHLSGEAVDDLKIWSALQENMHSDTVLGDVWSANGRKARFLDGQVE